MELVAAGLTAKPLEQQLSAEVTEGQREEGLPHLKVKTNSPSGLPRKRQRRYDTFCLLALTKLCVVSGTFSKTSTCNSSKVSQEMSVSQPIGFFSLQQQSDSQTHALAPVLITYKDIQTYLELLFHPFKGPRLFISYLNVVLSAKN